jgi:hypothetical protein
MRNANQVRKAAMGALVAVALMVGAGQAGAGPFKAPADEPKLPDARWGLLDGGRAGLMGKVRIALASAYRFPVEGGVRIRRWPASRDLRVE